MTKQIEIENIGSSPIKFAVDGKSEKLLPGETTKVPEEVFKELSSTKIKEVEKPTSTKKKLVEEEE